MKKSDFVIDPSSLKKALKDVNLNGNDVLQIEGAGAYTLVNGMRMRVPKDTHATENSIRPHIIVATDTLVIDEVGPETDYAYNIEYGIKSKPNYPIQPFIRPTAFEDFAKVIKAIGTAFGQIVVSRWPT